MKRKRVNSGDKPKHKHVPQHLLQMHKELSRAGGMKPTVFFIINVVILGLAPVFVMAGTVAYAFIAKPRIPFLVPGVIVLGLAVVALLVLMARRRLALLREYESTLPQRIRDAGLVRQLARGFDTLPDIFAYTKNPWRMLLGGRPQTTEQQLALLSNCMEWYLLPEPKAFFHPLWRGLPYVLVVLVGLAALVFMAASGMQRAGLSVPVPVLVTLVCVLAAGLVPVAYFGWQALYSMACGVAGTQVLRDAIREYVEEE